MTTSDIPRGRVRLYACGGGGINVGSRFERHRGVEESGFAGIEPVYIDTSRSNLKRPVATDSVYLLQGKDGSGGLRRENHQFIAERVRDMLQSHEPLDLNIVLSTGGGGSGSVIAPSLASELLDMDRPTVVVLIGGTETRLYAENTLNTLKSYQGVAKLRAAPLVVGYFQNSAETPRARVDDLVETMIASLGALFSRQNSELDSQDLYNWLRFDRVTTFGGALLAGLSLVDAKTQDLQELGNVISVATLAREPGAGQFPQMPEYQCTGYVPEDAMGHLLDNVPLHYVTSDGVIPAAAQQLQDLLKELESSQRARSRASNVLSSGDSTTENGLVL